MFGVSFPELIVVFVVALIAFGPDKLPELAKKLGRISADLRRGSDALRREFYNSVYPPAPNFTRNAPRPLTSSKTPPAPVTPDHDDQGRPLKEEGDGK